MTVADQLDVVIVEEAEDLLRVHARREPDVARRARPRSDRAREPRGCRRAGKRSIRPRNRSVSVLVFGLRLDHEQLVVGTLDPAAAAHRRSSRRAGQRRQHAGRPAKRRDVRGASPSMITWPLPTDSPSGIVLAARVARRRSASCPATCSCASAIACPMCSPEASELRRARLLARARRDTRCASRLSSRRVSTPNLAARRRRLETNDDDRHLVFDETAVADGRPRTSSPGVSNCVPNTASCEMKMPLVDVWPGTSVERSDDR